MELEARRISLEKWHGVRILDLFAAAATGKSNDGARNSFTKTAAAQLDNILEMASPFATNIKQAASKQELSMEQKIALLNKLNSVEDKSSSTIMNTFREAAASIDKKA